MGPGGCVGFADALSPFPDRMRKLLFNGIGDLLLHYERTLLRESLGEAVVVMQATVLNVPRPCHVNYWVHGPTHQGFQIILP